MCFEGLHHLLMPVGVQISPIDCAFLIIHSRLQENSSKGKEAPSSDYTPPSESGKGQQTPTPVITADTLFQDIQAVMGDAGRAIIHTRGLGSNPFARTHVHGYRGVAFEVMRNGHVASMTLFQV